MNKAVRYFIRATPQSVNGMMVDSTHGFLPCLHGVCPDKVLPSCKGQIRGLLSDSGWDGNGTWFGNGVGFDLSRVVPTNAAVRYLIRARPWLFPRALSAYLEPFTLIGSQVSWLRGLFLDARSKLLPSPEVPPELYRSRWNHFPRSYIPMYPCQSIEFPTLSVYALSCRYNS